jgi:hypothetical protein
LRRGAAQRALGEEASLKGPLEKRHRFLSGNNVVAEVEGLEIFAAVN